MIWLYKPGVFRAKDLLLPGTLKEWRAWLLENWDSGQERELRLPVAQEAISANVTELREEALRFGWVLKESRPAADGYRMVRFAPWREGEPCTRWEIEKLLRLEQQERLHPPAAEKLQPLLRAPFTPPADILRRLKADPKVWQNYRQLPEGYQRAALAYVDEVRKQPAEFIRRLRLLMTKTKENKRLPVWQEEK